MAKALVAVSEGFASSAYITRHLTKLFREVPISAIEVVDKTDGPMAKAVQSLSIPWRLVSYPQDLRSDAGRLVKDTDLVVVFWDGESLSKLLFESRLQQKRTRVYPVEVTKIVNKDRGDAHDVYIGRGTPWGNPFHVGTGPGRYTREEAIRLFVDHFHTNILSVPRKRTAILAMRGFKLACHCKPLECHGDVIAEYLNSIDPDDPTLLSFAKTQQTLSME
jgi:hypothetical protein